MSEKVELVIKARDETMAAFNAVNTQLGTLKQKADGFLAGGFGGVGGAFGGGLVTGLLGAGFTTAIKGAIDDLDKLDEAAERIGLTTESLSALTYAGQLSGVEFEDMTTAISRLSVKMQEAASGGKEAVALFKDVGVSVKDSNGNLKSADTVMAELANRFSSFENGAAKTALAVDIFGKSGAKLVPMLNQGAAGLEAMRKEAESLGGIIDSKLAKQAADFNDNLDRMGKLSSSVGKSITGELLPPLNEFLEKLLMAKRSDLSFGQIMLDVLPKQDGNVFERIERLKREISGFQSMIGDARKQSQFGWTDQSLTKKIEESERLLKYLENISNVQNSKSLNGFDDNPIGFNAGGGTAITRTPSGAGKTKKENDDLADFLKEVERRAKPAEDALERFRKMQVDFSASGADLTKSQQALLEVMSDPSWQDMAEPYKESILAAAELADQSEALVKSQERLSRLLEDTDATKIQQWTADFELLQSALERGKINQEQFDQAISASAKRYGDSFKDAEEKVDGLTEFAKSAAHNMQSAFADFLFDPFGDGTKNMGEKFSIAIRRMVADAASANIMNAIFGNKTVNGGLDFGKLFSAFGGSGSGASSTPDSVWYSPELPSFAVGTDYVPHDMIDKIHEGERIVPKAQNIAGSGGVTFVVNNLSGIPLNVSSQRQTVDSRGHTTIEAMVDQQAAVGLMSSGSATSRAMAGRYGARPALVGR